MKKLQEATRSQLINKSRNAGPYKDQSKGRNRYARRVYSKQANTVSQYNKIDMNTFFKEDRLKIGIPVIGETKDYIVNMEFNGVLEDIQKRIKNNNNKLEFKVIYQALISKFNSGDVYIGCNCPDNRYRFSYFQTINDYRSGEPETRPSDITNPTDNKGAGCKHILLVLSNLNWLLKVCSVINNYIHYSKDHLFRNYADIIFPKLYGIKYQGDVQLSLEDDKDADLDISNAYGRSRTRFKPNNPYRFTKRTPAVPENQLKLDIEEEEPENNSNLRRH